MEMVYITCHCGNITKEKYCSDKCYQTRHLKFNSNFTSLPYSAKYYHGVMKWGYGNLKSDRNRQSKDQKWIYKYPKSTRHILEFNNENTLAALKIQKLAGNMEIQILLSGGLDSIIVAETFRQGKIPFTPVTWRFTNGKNKHDIKHARKYCEKYNLKQKFIDIDIEDFLFNKILDYSMPTQTINPGRAVMCYIIDKLDGFPVFGGGEPFVYYDDCVRASEGEQMQYIEKWLIYRNRPGIGRFFRTTTEQVLSGLISKHFWKIICFMEKEQISPYGSPRKEYKENSTMQTKTNVYRKYYPSIDVFRPAITHEWQGPKAGLIQKTTSYTGYEHMEKEFRISNYIQQKRLPLQIFQHWINEPVMEKIRKLERILHHV